MAGAVARGRAHLACEAGARAATGVRAAAEAVRQTPRRRSAAAAIVRGLESCLKRLS